MQSRKNQVPIFGLIRQAQLSGCGTHAGISNRPTQFTVPAAAADKRFGVPLIAS